MYETILAFIVGGVLGGLGTAIAKHMNNKLDRCYQIVAMINELREHEASVVIICCENPDFNGGPDNVIDCEGYWTGWQTKRYGGATLDEALASAIADYRRVKDGHT